MIDNIIHVQIYSNFRTNNRLGTYKSYQNTTSVLFYFIVNTEIYSFHLSIGSSVTFNINPMESLTNYR